jgi:hypothetical protein
MKTRLLKKIKPEFLKKDQTRTSWKGCCGFPQLYGNWERNILNAVRWANWRTSNLSHGRPPFLNPLGKGKARSSLARLASLAPSRVSPRATLGFKMVFRQGKTQDLKGADSGTKPNKNRLDWWENIQRKFEGIRGFSVSTLLHECDLLRVLRN